ncbi:MAG: hypothetical protein ACOYXC_10985, partial [Candidatus Rifleibacteriota bacterium]
MKSLKISLALVLFIVLTGCAFAAPSLEAVQRNIFKASNLWENDHAGAQKILKNAFADAISYTRPEFIDRIREKGFLLAVSCYSPELAEEAMLAAETYLKVFPKGRYIGNIKLFKAIDAFAGNRNEEAISLVDQARSAMGRSLNYKEQTLFMDAYITANHHRSAEQFIEGQRLVRPSSRLTRDLRKFHRGNDRIENTLTQLKNGKISGIAAAERIEKELQYSYFAKKAPEAALTAVAIKDTQKLAYNPVGLEWCGLTRAVKHSSSPQLREKKYREFLSNYPQAAPAETYQALQNLKNIYLYEMRDKIQAIKTIEAMKKVPGFAERAEIEETFSSFEPRDLLTESGLKFIKKMFETPALLPYDNGALPVLEKDYANYLLMIAEMANGQNYRGKIHEGKGWGGLPISLLYSAATNNKDRSWEVYQQIKASLTPQVDRMLEDVIFPLYLNTDPGERYFLAGLAAVERMPDL